MKELFSEIEIDARAERVWEILMDFKSYPDWNPFVRRIEGEAAHGERLRVTMQLEGRKSMVFKPRIKNHEPPREFRWLGHLILPGLFDGEHVFLIESLAENRIRFIQREYFSGILASPFLKGIDAQTQAGFEAMNLALKERAET